MLAQNLPQGAIVLVDKPAACTSHDVVARLRRVFATRKVGHAGTLDPLATGLLIGGVGPATRLLTYLVGLDKTYSATIRLGQATLTDDSAGEIISVAEIGKVQQLAKERGRIAAAIAELTGQVAQRPSAVSAIKVAGRRAYARVREGENVELAARQVQVYEFAAQLEAATVVPDVGNTVLDFQAEIRCSSGTYVRALARDLGASLGVGGHLTALRRSAVGPFAVSAALSLAKWQSLDPAEISQVAALYTPAALARLLFPVLELSAWQATALQQGKRLVLADADARDADIVAAILPASCDSGDSLIGLVRVRQGIARVLMNFPPLTEREQ